MDQSGWSWEQKTLISELIQGMELAKQLKLHLSISTKSSMENRDSLLQRILSSYEKALLIVHCSGSTGQAQNVGANITGVAVPPESPLSINGSPRSDDFDNKDNRESSKKRKILPRWTDQVRVSSESLLEGPNDDGYSWRKYGQKDILGAQYPRSYYRCTYRNTQNCWATKQVQRSDEDPTIFEVTYRGTHTCSLGSNNQAVPPPASPEKQEQKPTSSNNHHHSNNNVNTLNNPQQHSQELFLNFRKNLKVNTGGLDNKQEAMAVAPSFSFPSTSVARDNRYCFSPAAMDNSNNALGGFSPSFMSPATPELNYLALPYCQMGYFGEGALTAQRSESDLTGLISGDTSATNSPIMDLDFSLDPVELDPNFPFDTPGFFS